jgi:hypothetical protein
MTTPPDETVLETQFQKAAAEFEKGMADFRPGGPHWESRQAGFKNEPQLKARFVALGIDPMATSKAPPVLPDSAKDDASREDPPKLDGNSPDDVVAEQELRARWSENFDKRFADCQQVRDELMPPGDPTGEFVFDHFVTHFGNNPDFLELLAGIKERIADLPREKVNIAGMSLKQKESIASSFAVGLLGNLRSPIAQQIVQSLGENPDPKFLNWAAELGARYYRQGQGDK